jgi:hypothetical protein
MESDSDDDSRVKYRASPDPMLHMTETYNITATASNKGATATASVTVVPFTITPPSITLLPGSTQRFTSTSGGVTWSVESLTRRAGASRTPTGVKKSTAWQTYDTGWL